MPDLPTITVTDAQATKLLEFFGDADAYKAWLREAIKREIRSRAQLDLINANFADAHPGYID